MKNQATLALLFIIANTLGASKIDDAISEARRMCVNDSSAQALLRLDELINDDRVKKEDKYTVQLEKGDILLYYSRLYDEAAQVYQGLITYDIDKKDNGLLYYRLGLALENGEDFVGAARAYEKVVTDYSDSPCYQDALSAIERCFIKNYEVRVASVDGYPVTQLEIDELISKLSPNAQKEASTPQGRMDLIEQVVYERLLKKAANQSFASPDSTEILIKLKCQSCRPKNVAVPGPLTDRELIRTLKRSERGLLLGDLYKKEVTDKVEVTEKEKKRFYKDNPDQFVIKSKYTIREIVVDSVSIDSVTSMLDSEVSFDSVASLFSTVPSKNQGGLIQSRYLSQFSTAAQPIIEKLAAGEISEPFQTERGTEIVLLEEKTVESRRSYDEVEGMIDNLLIRDKTEQSSQEALDRFRESAGVDTVATETYLATVAGGVIDNDDVDYAISRIPTRTAEQEMDTVFRREVLEQIISEKVFDHELAQQRLFLRDSVYSRLESERRQLIVGAYLRNEVETPAHPTDDQIEQYYKEHKKDYWYPSQVRVREILVSSKEDAQMIYDLLSEGYEFDSLAQVYSQAETAQRKGYVGYIKQDQSDKPYERQAFKLKDNSFSKPIKTDEGYWLIMVEGKTKEYQKTAQEAHSAINQVLYKQKKDELEIQLRERLFSQASVSYFEETELPEESESTDEMQTGDEPLPTD